jgi:hypothetical protein
MRSNICYLIRITYNLKPETYYPIPDTQYLTPETYE